MDILSKPPEKRIGLIVALVMFFLAEMVVAADVVFYLDVQWYIRVLVAILTIHVLVTTVIIYRRKVRQSDGEDLKNEIARVGLDVAQGTTGKY